MHCTGHTATQEASLQHPCVMTKAMFDDLQASSSQQPMPVQVTLAYCRR